MGSRGDSGLVDQMLVSKISKNQNYLKKKEKVINSRK